MRINTIWLTQRGILIGVLTGTLFPAGSSAQSENANDNELEETVVIGRLKSAAEALVDERIELPFSADYLGFETISQAGDSNLAAALRRVPGLTVIEGKFVYVRGLGERYSSVTVNGAAVPSPELTRSVIPLDLFPTSIVDSIQIQKSPSPNQPAAFGGGAIDIRTKSIPDELALSLSIGSGQNTESSGNGLSYSSSSDQLPGPIRAGISTYRGNISVSNILNTLNFDGTSHSLQEAQTIHQSLINSLNTNVGIDNESLDPDIDAKIGVGNAWEVGDGWRIGVLANSTYKRDFRNEDQRREGVGDPDRNFVDIERTVDEERVVAALNLGLGYLDEHAVEASYYYLENNEAVASIARGFDQNNEFPDQKLNYSTRLEERQLQMLQFSGEHGFTQIPYVSGLLSKILPQDTAFNWFYSDSTAQTDIPNESDFQASALLNADGGQTSTQVLATTSSGKFSFLELEDEQTSWGGDIVLPWIFNKAELTLSSGWWGSKKVREYFGYNVNLNSVGVQSSVLAGTPADLLALDRLTIANGFDLSLGSNFGNESYLAVQKIDAGYGMVDIIWNNSWRFTGGARYENFQQAALPIDLLDFTGSSIRELQADIGAPDQRIAVQEDDIYGSLAFTYIGNDFLGATDYQVRFSYGQTVVRPDLREIADVVYIDPQLDIRVRGNPALETSDIDNFELRSEFFYDSGDNFTVSLFYKDIAAPIESVRAAGSDDDVVLSFINATSGELYGFELEGLKDLGRGFFLQGNFTFGDSKLDIDSELATLLTNDSRRLTGHSEYVVNTTLGFDSPNGKHSAYLNYNVFGERIFFAGTTGNDDAFELPFHSVGVVYKYYPIDNIELTFKADNILDEAKEFEQKGRNGQRATIIEQDVGTSFSLGLKWQY